jgi:hypothetical protein
MPRTIYNSRGLAFFMTNARKYQPEQEKQAEVYLIAAGKTDSQTGIYDLYR